MIKWFVLLFCTSKLNGFKIDGVSSKENEITSDIVTQFSGFNTIFHFDNKTNTNIDVIMVETQINRSYFMINYDKKARNEVILLRPPGYKFLHVVLLQEYKRFDRYMQADQFNLEYQDVILFVINLHVNETGFPVQKFEVWEPNRLNRSGTVFVVDSLDLSLYKMCFYCGNVSKTLQKITKFEANITERLQVPRLTNLTNKFKNFNNHVFRVAYTEYKPYFWNIVNSNTSREVFGSEGELLACLSEKFQFGLHLVEFSGMADIWKEMVDAVRDRKVDWAIGGITVSIDRCKVADFTNFIRPEPYTALYSVYEDIWMSWQNILMPFELALWLAIAGTTTSVALLLYFAIRFTHSHENFHLFYYMQSCWRFLVEQAMPDIPPILKSRWTTMWLMALWWMMALIITTAYKSKLTSSLINSRANEPNSIDGLVQRGFRFQTNKEDSSVLQENLKFSNDPVFLEVLKRSKNDTDFCPSVLKTINRRIAVIDEETTLNYEVLTNCRKKMSVTEQEDLRLIRDELFPSTQAWPLQLAAPYRTSFSNAISRMHAAGLFRKWQDDSVSGGVQLIPKSHQGSTSNAEPKFSLVTILGPGLIWMLGAICSCLVFLAEKCKGKKDKKNKKKIKKEGYM